MMVATASADVRDLLLHACGRLSCCSVCRCCQRNTIREGTYTCKHSQPGQT
jgi:hypothetical protein